MSIKRLSRYVLCLLGMIQLSCASVYAQEELDTMKIEELVDTIFKDIPAPKTISFNPAQYIHINRYLTQGDSVRAPRWWNRLFFGASSGLFGLTDKEWTDHNVPIELSLGYMFNKYSSIRVTGRYVQMPRRAPLADVRSLGLDVDYMFNLTNYLYGFNPNRFLNISLVPGVGYVYTHREDEHANALKLQFGVHVGFQLARNFELFAEPWFGVATDRVNLANHSGYYDGLYGVKLGASVHLRPSQDDSDSTNHKPFIEFSQGILAIHRPSETWGTSYQLSVGTWVNQFLGFRAGFAGRNFYWGARTTPSVVAKGVQIHPQKDEWSAGTYLGARVEAMFNPLNLMEKWRTREGFWKNLNLTVSAGAEYGWLIKYNTPGTESGLRKYYYGITAASQLSYALSRRTEIFVEPRWSWINYSIPYDQSADVQKFTDKEASMNIGVRLQPYTRFEKSLRNVAYDSSPSLSRLSFMAAFGGARHVRSTKLRGDAAYNLNLQAGVAYEFSPLFTLRLRADYLRYVFNQEIPYTLSGAPSSTSENGLFRNTNHILTAKLGYMLNMNNLLQGYDANRKFNVFVEAGPMFSWNVKRRVHFGDGENIPANANLQADPYQYVKNSFGIYGAVVADYRFAPRWSVFAQSEMSGHFTKDFLSAPGSFGGIRNNWLLQVSVGAAYHLDDMRGGEEGGEDDVNHKPFFEYSQGMTAIHRPSETWGTGYQVAVGTWINPYLGARAGFAGRNFYWGAGTHPAVWDKGVQIHPEKTEWYAGTFMGFRFEALLNPLNIFEKWREKDHKFNVNLSMGLEAGRVIKYGTAAPSGLRRYYYGVTGSAQFLYALSRRAQIFVEPRLSLITYTLPEGNMSDWKKYTDKEADLNIGVRLQPYTRSEKESRDSYYDTSLSWNRLSVMAAFGGARHVRSSKLLGDASFNMNLQAGVAYEFSPYVTMRLRAEYLRYAFNHEMSYKLTGTSGPRNDVGLFRNTNHILTTKLGYMLNMNNLLQGYDANRKFNVFVEAGPMFSWNVKRRIHFSDDESVPSNAILPTDPYDDIKSSFGVFGAVVADYKLSSRWSVFAQSEMSAHFRQNFLSAPGSFGGVRNNWLLQASIGAAYHLDEMFFKGDDEEEGTFSHKPFFEYSQGMTAIHRPSETWGTGYELSVGTWFNPYVGVRGGFAGRNFYWGASVKPAVSAYGIQVHPEKTEWHAGTYMGLRLEALVNPMNFFEQWRENDHKFSINVSMGVEAGRMIKYGTASPEGLRRYYYGFTGAAQFLYALSRRASVFVEPRLSLINYTLGESNMAGWKRYTDKEADLNIGVRLQPYNRSEKDSNDSYFDSTPSLKHLTVTAALGGARHVRPSKTLGDEAFSMNLQVGASYELSPLCSFRLRAEYMRYVSNQEMSYYVYGFASPIRYDALFRTTNNVLTTKLGYMLNMNNLLQGYDADRKFNVYVEAGPMMSWSLGRQYEFCKGELVGGDDFKILDPSKNNTSSFGIYGGVVADYRLTPHISVIAQSEMSGLFRQNFLSNSSGFASLLNNWLLQVSVGAAYRF